MAKVVITRSWPNCDALQITVAAESSYPDALAEAKRICLDAYAEALDLTCAPAEGDE